MIQIIQHVINKFKSYEIIEVNERIATAQRRRAIKKNILKIKNKNAWTRISKNFKKAQQQKIKILIKIMNKNTNQCQSIEKIKKIQEKLNETRINIQSISFLFSISFTSWKCDLKNDAISSRWLRRELIKLFRLLSTVRRTSEWNKSLSNDIIRRSQRKQIDQSNRNFLKHRKCALITTLNNSRRWRIFIRF